jgi:hypothetical protein
VVDIIVYTELECVHVINKEGVTMVRVDLFHPWTPNVYGTASYLDVLTVCGAAALFCTVVGLIVFGVVRVFLV